MAETAQTYSAADPVAENNVRSDQTRRERADADVLRKIMHDREGRDWVYRFLERCHIFGGTFQGEDTHVTAFRLGEENVGKQFVLELQGASVDLYMKMVKEQKDEERRLAKVRREEAQKREKRADPPLTPNMQFPPLTPPAGWKE